MVVSPSLAAMEEQLLGLSDLMPQQEDPLAQAAAMAPVRPPLPPAVGAAAAAAEAEAVPLPRLLFSFGVSPSGPASAEMLMSLLHHEGTKSVDARLKECGVKSMGSRLKIQSAAQKALTESAAVPKPPSQMAKPVACQVGGVIVVTGDVDSIKERPARDVCRELEADDPELLVLAATADREVLCAELKRRGFKTGARLKLERALPTLARERAAAENERLIEEAREAALQAALEEQRAIRTAALTVEAEAALAAEEARVAEEEAQQAEMEALYEQYQRELAAELAAQPTEVDKLKAQRRRDNAAKREAAEAEAAAAAAAAAAEAAEAAATVEGEAPTGESERHTAPGVDAAQASARASLPPTDDEALLVDVCEGVGGVQGLAWYNASMQRDEDGDEAQEFVELDVP